MTEITVKVPDDLAEKAREAGLLSAKAFEALLREAIGRRNAAGELLSVADRVAAANVLPMAEQAIQAEVTAVRKARRRRRSAQGRR